MAIVGIDLGTSCSALAAWGDAEPRLLPNALGEPSPAPAPGRLARAARGLASLAGPRMS